MLQRSNVHSKTFWIRRSTKNNITFTNTLNQVYNHNAKNYLHLQENNERELVANHSPRSAIKF